MEQRLRKQRARLFRRITLVLVAVWLTVSATYFFIRVYNEKSNIQNRMLSDVTYIKHNISERDPVSGDQNYYYISNTSLLYLKEYLNPDNDVQLTIIDPGTDEVMADTSYKLNVYYTFSTSEGAYPDDYGFIDRREVLKLMDDRQADRIKALLSSDSGDGRVYRLICTEFYAFRDLIMPMELAVILTDNPDGRFDPSAVVERFRLTDQTPENTRVFTVGSNRFNLLPEDFLFGDNYNREPMAYLSDEQRQSNIHSASTDIGEYVFYVSDYIYVKAFVFNHDRMYYEKISQPFLLQYASRVNIISNCKNDLALGVLLAFAFFFLIWLILISTVWHTVRNQINQEQKRLELTNALAHDIKTPLFVISGYAYSLREDIDPGERELYLDKIISQTEHINSLVHKMLNLSKLDSYGVTLSRSDFDLCALTEEILSDYRSLPDGRSISLTHSGDCTVSADRELLRTAIQNLTENAVKYSPPGSEIRVDVTDGALTISNPSEPLTKAEIKQLWQPYVRKDRSRHNKGNGLGLSIVKSIMELHGAKYSLSMKDDRLVFYTNLRLKEDK